MARSNDPLPRQVDVRRLIAAGTEISAQEPLKSFARFTDMLESDSGVVDIELRFYVDEAGIKRIDGELHAEVSVLCQRCLGPMPLVLDTEFSVALVWSDAEAACVPRALDPHIAGDEPEDLRPLLEDELIVSLPFVSYHEREDCAGMLEPAAGDEQYQAQTERKENPFTVLERLKSGH
ncbi:MAG: YceD family protein [Spongiibacteraceae bacterium]|jgi:uncharacterized protein|nr:YceD family protein [Spongiibacteraceae bacterium]